MICERCGHDIQVGEWPICGGHPGNVHESGLGMQGEFHEYTDQWSFVRPTHFTSLAERNKTERAAGLEPITPQEARDMPSHQEQSRRALAHEQSRPENKRARVSAILQAMEQHGVRR